MRLRDLYLRDADGQARMTWRELGVYVRGLPPGSATRTAQNDGKPEPTGEQILIADVWDKIGGLDWTLRAVNTPENKPMPKPPARYPRWWEQDRGKRKNSPARVARIEDARKRAAARRRQIAAGQIA